MTSDIRDHRVRNFPNHAAKINSLALLRSAPNIRMDGRSCSGIILSPYLPNPMPSHKSQETSSFRASISSLIYCIASLMALQLSLIFDRSFPYPRPGRCLPQGWRGDISQKLDCFSRNLSLVPCIRAYAQEQFSNCVMRASASDLHDVKYQLFLRP